MTLKQMLGVFITVPISALTLACGGVSPQPFAQTDTGQLSDRSSDLRRAASNTHPSTLYVSTEGNDRWTGTLAWPNDEKTDGPFATIGKARDAIRGVKQQNKGLKQPVTVYIRGGVYALTEPLEFTHQDSGTADFPITYAAFPGEYPTISGGRHITGWQLADMDGAGGQGVWTARVPGMLEGKWDIRQLFVNGQRRQRARTPNKGWFPIPGVAPLQGGCFNFRTGDIRAEWATLGDVEVVVFVRWRASRLFIKEVDPETNTVRMSGVLGLDVQDWNARYYVENAPEAFDEAGEWYLDRTSGTLFYRPLPGEDMASSEVIAPATTELVRLRGGKGNPVSHLRFVGLTLRYSNWSLPANGFADIYGAIGAPSALNGINAESCSIEKCEFSRLGGHAIVLAGKVRDVKVIGNKFCDIGAGGVMVGDYVYGGQLNSAADNLIADNEIDQIGHVYHSAVGVHLRLPQDTTVEHNHIHHTFYSGVTVRGPWENSGWQVHSNLVAYNHIHDIGQGVMSDLGCIYTEGIQPETVVRNNLCHDVTSYDWGAWGIYLDNNSCGITVEDNIVYRTRDGGFLQHFGYDNVIRNNVFAYGKNQQILRFREDPQKSFTFEHNIVVWKEGSLLRGYWSNNNYSFDYNTYFQTAGAAVEFNGWNLEQWRLRGQDLHSLVTDPLFVDPDHGDYGLRPGSPALTLGFQPIDMTEVGPRR